MTVLMFFATVLLIWRDFVNVYYGGFSNDNLIDELLTFTAYLLEVSYELVLLWFIQRFVDIAADVRAEQREREKFTAPSDSFFYQSIQMDYDPEQLGAEFPPVVAQIVNTQARQVMNAFVSYPKGVDPVNGLAKREKKHGTEYRND